MNKKYFQKDMKALLVGLLSLVMVFTQVLPSSYAGDGPQVRRDEGSGVYGNDDSFIGGLNGFKDEVLDAVEQLVWDSGLVDVKKKLWEDYKVLVKPFFKSGYRLTSNVFNAPDDDSDHADNIWTFTPGVQVLHKNSLGVIGAAFETTFKYFTKFPGQNTQDPKMLIYANLFPTENTYIRFSEKLQRIGHTSGTSALEPVDVTENTVTVVTGYRYNDRWTLEFGYENFDREFENTIAKGFSYNENKYDLRAYYQLNPNTKVWTGMRLGYVNFIRNNNRDTLYWELPVGVETRLPLDIYFRGSAGVHRRDLRSGRANDHTYFVTNLSLQKSFNADKTSISGGFLRRPVESAFSTATIYDEKLWYLNAKHLVNNRLRLRASTYVGNRDFEDPVFTGTRVVVGGRVFVTPPTRVKRDDDVFGFGFGLDYNVRKWLILHADYNYNRRNSNISALDFTENAMTLKSTIPL